MTSRPKSKIPNEWMRLTHKSVASVLVLTAILALFTAVINQAEALGLKISHFWESCPLLGIIYDSIFKINLLQKWGLTTKWESPTWVSFLSEMSGWKRSLNWKQTRFIIQNQKWEGKGTQYIWIRVLEDTPWQQFSNLFMITADSFHSAFNTEANKQKRIGNNTKKPVSQREQKSF